MLKKVVCAGIVFVLAAAAGFTQSASAVREYVGRVSQEYHPDLAEYMGKVRRQLEKEGSRDGVKAVDAILKGKGGSGFIYTDAAGNNYVITNYHVVTQSYTLAIEFEKADGGKTIYDNLKLIFVDEDKDMALLAFPEGRKPFKAGMSFTARAVEEGETVYSAGFPGLIDTQVWQFGQGIVSNAFVKFPNPDDKDKTMGPYIQHTAPVDPGNSGGPLMVAQAGVPSGYAVAGINTLSVPSRQATGYSIPADGVREFLTKALAAPGDERQTLEGEARAFLNGLGANRAVYPHIAKYVSSSCTARNAEYSLDEMFEKATVTARGNIIKTFETDPVAGMKEAVAWLIESTLRGKGTKINASLGAIKENAKGGCTVSIQVGEAVIDSEWVKEYGLWRIDTFGAAVSGDKSLVAAKEEAREQNKRLKTDYDVLLSAAYTQILDRGPAANAEVKFKSGDYLGWVLSGFYAGSDFWQAQMGWTLEVPIRFNSAGFAVSPFIEGGFGFMNKKIEKPSADGWGDTEAWCLLGQFQAGLLVTTAALPNVYFKAAYQGNGYSQSDDDDDPKADKSLILVGIGYAF